MEGLFGLCGQGGFYINFYVFEREGKFIAHSIPSNLYW